MKNEEYSKIQRAIGMIDGVAAVSDSKVSDALDRAAELLEEVLESAWGAGPEEQVEAGAEPGIEPEVLRVIWYDTERYLPPEDGWYIAEVVGYENAIPVWYHFGTQVFENTGGEDVKVLRWKRLEG